MHIIKTRHTGPRSQHLWIKAKWMRWKLLPYLSAYDTQFNSGSLINIPRLTIV